jgi:hypothetical protein
MLDKVEQEGRIKDLIEEVAGTGEPKLGPRGRIALVGGWASRGPRIVGVVAFTETDTPWRYHLNELVMSEETSHALQSCPGTQ